MNATSEPCGARPRLLVDQAHAVRLEPRQRRHDVVHAQRDVVQARSPLLEISGDRRVPAVASRSSSADFAGRDEVRPHPLRRDLFWRLDRQAERIAIEREGLFQLPDGDADVIERR